MTHQHSIRTTETTARLCDDCKKPITTYGGSPDGWQLEDGRSVCQVCAVRDLRGTVEQIMEFLTAIKPVGTKRKPAKGR